jgi:YegS/Rv2252/BmrU family lipid kinase
MRVCVIFNPTARGDKARRFRGHLDELGGQCTLRPTTDPGAATALAEAAVREGFDTIVAAGGDGTVNEVLNGLARAPAGLERARLGVLGLGTVNVFAKEHRLPLEFNAAWALIQSGAETRIDLPQVEFMAAGAPRRLWFAQMAGAGLDARAIERVRWQWKKLLGPGAYVLAGLSALRGRQPRITVTAPGRSASGELVLLGNGRFYGGCIPVFPGADARDGLLEVRVFPRAHLWAVVRFGFEWLAGWGRGRASQDCFSAATVRLESSEPAPFELDGDNVGSLPATFSIQRQAVRLIAP